MRATEPARVRIALIYNVLHAGGCEMRMAEIAKVLRDRGDEVWLLGSGVTPEGEVALYEHVGIPREGWVLTSDAQCQPFMEWILPTLRDLRPDVADVQWNCQIPKDLGVPTVVTAHGDVPMPAKGEYNWQAFIQVETFESEYYARDLCPIYAEVWNWVDLDRFHFSADRGDGVAFFGRLFKTPNLRTVWERYDGRIHVYGMKYPEDNFPWPPNAEWRGFTDPAKVMADYAVIFGGARVALEGLATGRAVIAGYPWPGWVPWGDLVTRSNIADMAARQFVGRYRDDGTMDAPTAEHVWGALQCALVQRDLPASSRELRSWVEEHHEMRKQVAKIREVYEKAIASA